MTDLENYEDYEVGLWSMEFYLINDDGDALRNDDGSIKLFDAPNIDFSSSTEGIEPDDLVEIKQKEEDFSVFFVWHIDDVLDAHPHLSKEQAKDVLLNCKKNHDATIGMNWEVINQTVEFLYPQETQ